MFVAILTLAAALASALGMAVFDMPSHFSLCIFMAALALGYDLEVMDERRRAARR